MGQEVVAAELNEVGEVAFGSFRTHPRGMEQLLSVVSVPDRQRRLVEKLARTLGEVGRGKRKKGGVRCTLVGPGGERAVVPDAIVRILEQATGALARGDTISVVPMQRELTTQQAAKLLNVSRQYLVRLLEEGRIPFRKTGKHRRVWAGDVLAFKARRDQERLAGLGDLVRMSEALGGYDPEAPP